MKTVNARVQAVRTKDEEYMTDAIEHSPGTHCSTALTDRDEQQLTISLPSVGSGVMRSSATYIGVILQVEPGDPVGVLVDAAKAAGLSLDDIIAEWEDEVCRKCGTGKRLHEHGVCP